MKIVRGGLVVTTDPEDLVLQDGAVVVDGPTIVDVGPWSAIRPRYPAVEILGGDDTIVLPGFVNAHNHMFQVLYRNLGADRSLNGWMRDVIWPMSHSLQDQEAYWATLLASLEMLRSGTTTVVDSHYINTSGSAVDAVAEAVERIGIRAVLGRASVNWSEFAEIPGEFVETPAAAQRAAADLIRRWHGRADGRIRIRPEPLSETAADGDMIRALHDVAVQYGTGMNMHAAEQLDRVEFIRGRFGTVGTIAYLDRLGVLDPRLLLAHCVWLAPEEIALLSERGVKLVHNPISNQFLGDGIAPLPELAAAGITVGLGTDGPCSNDSLDMFAVMKAGALIHKSARRDGAITQARRIVGMATRGSATAAGIGHLVGSLEVGKRADVILMRRRGPEMVPLFDVMAALVYGADRSAVETVMVDGRVVLERGSLTTLREDEIIAEAERLAWSLLSRAGTPELRERATRWGLFPGSREGR